MEQAKKKNATLKSFGIRKNAIESQPFEKVVFKYLEALNSFSQIVTDIKCHHKKNLQDFLTKELELNPDGDLPIYMFKFLKPDII